jgi:hypothetical protein
MPDSFDLSANALTEIRTWARISHTFDDAAIQLAYSAAVVELEARTGWCYVSVQRTQYVAREPVDDAVRAPYISYVQPTASRLIRLARQPATACTGVDGNGASITITLVEVDGIKFAKVATGLVYPLTLTVTAGTGTLDPLLKLALMQRVVQHVQSRGDDTMALSSDYWDNITRMVGKGIG